jgi:3-hydroxyacyl-CoA dehydrogenase / enoyl-CoA hydratase / 3-hydroxybutyryl-CoA epimerase
MVADNAGAAPTGRHWRSERDGDGIHWLTFDKQGASANTLSQEVLEELDHALDRLRSELPRGVVIRSGKTGGFVLGADVKEFQRLESAAEGARVAAQGQALLAKIEALDVPTVAAIDGFALGGGLELALACRYRVAVESHQRNLGLPEVQLGIHPGFGGTVRAVELLGALRALDLMLTGRSISPVEARQIGVVDRLASAGTLDAVARELILEAPTRRRAPWHLRCLNLAPVRMLLARSLRARVAKRARREHYPAPYALIALWVRHGGKGARAYQAEAESIGQLLVTSTCRNLVRIFLLRERLRNLAPRAAAVERVHVVGAGVMGGDIAAWCALRGIDVSLQDRSDELVRPALERAGKLFARRLRGPGEAESAQRRLRPDVGAATVGDAEIVIEAIVEKLDAKQSLLRDLEPRLGNDAIIATNTSSLVLEDIATALTRPQRLVGLHFFNPVAKLPLVEVIHGKQTDKSTLEQAMSFVTQIGKLPLPCRSAPGFLVNRILMPYMLEALLAHQDGHAFETIDAAATRFGMPVGPVELADRVGLDVALHVARILGQAFGLEVPAVLERKVEAGELGIKSGRGFYEYQDGKARKRRDAPAPLEALTDRLILAMVNEAMACYQDRIVEDLDLLDAGVVFGTGFAPHTGGPINYARARGVREVITTLEHLADSHGPRFSPHGGWHELRSES